MTRKLVAHALTLTGAFIGSVLFALWVMRAIAEMPKPPQ